MSDSRQIWTKIANGEELYHGLLNGLIEESDLPSGSYRKIIDWADRSDEVDDLTIGIGERETELETLQHEIDELVRENDRLEAMIRNFENGSGNE